MILLNANERSDPGMTFRLGRRFVFLTALFAGTAVSGCTGGEEASGSLGSSGSAATISSTARTIATSETQHVVLAVKGMYCGSCEQTVVTMLRRTAGVLRADVSVERGEAAVSYNSTRTSPVQLVQVVNRLGYEASVKRT